VSGFLRSIVAVLFPAILFLATVAAQNLDLRDLTKPLGSTWPTYNGDYSGRRFSQLSQITASNVKDLRLVWTYDSGNDPIKATPLMVDGVIYFSVPDKAWALDARSGRLIWHWETKTRGGTHIGHRGVAMYGNWLFLVTPDDYLVL
jgi:alcohol dehydrogenase (cytochrome c)